MGATYTRQSTITDGAVIEASHFNDEYNQLLAAFAASTGHTHDGTAAEGGPITKLLGNTLTFGAATAGTDITITFDGETSDGVFKWMEDEDYFEFSDDLLVASTEKLQFRDTAIYINSSADGQLDLVADTEIQIAATTVDINGNVDISGTLTVAGALDFGDAAISNVGALQLDSIAGDGDTNTSITFSGSDVITIATGGAGRLTIGDGALSPVTNNQIDLGTASLEFKDAFFDGTVTADAFAGNVTGNVSGTAATVTGAAQSNITSLGTLTTLTVDNVIVNGTTIGHTSDTDLLTLADGVLTIAGDLVVSGDDITMGTNTAGNLLVADGTNFNSIAVGSLSEISTVANDDVFLAVDTSGGGLKRISRSAVVSGLASSSALSNVVEDTSPQLGGNLDMNGADIVTTSNATIDLAPNGTGTVVVRGNTNSGRVVFNCESNSHGQTLASQPHSASATNTMLLPQGANSTLVSLVSTDTLTNKTLTSPKVNEDVAVTTTATEINLIDGDTSRGTTAVATGDGILINDGGTMRMTNVDTVSTYFAGHSVGGSNIVTTGALNSGSITSGFGTINNGASTITTTGLISGGSLDIDNVLINGTTIGHTDDTDLITVADGLVTVAGEVQMTTLDIGGTNVTSTAAEINYSDLATLGTTAASKVFTADANGLTKVSGAVLNTEDTLTDGSTIAWDVIASPVAKVTLAGNRTFAAPSGTTPAAGQFVSLLLIQDGTGSRTITWNAVYEFAADTAPTLTTTANLGDLFVFRYNGAKWLEVGRNLALTLS